MMKRIHKTFKALGLLIKNPWKLNLILDQNDEWAVFVRKKYKIASLPVIPLNSFIQDTVLVEPYAFLDGGSFTTDIALLKQLASDIPKCRYFEIGTWRGESVANVAVNSEICYTLNLPEEELYKLINSESFVSSHRFFSKNLKNVVHLSGDSRTFDFGSLNIKFDLVFIDGDHHYETVVKDTRNILEHLCHENTIIVWHDYTYTPESIRYETLAAIMDACSSTLYPFLFHVENTNCAVLYRKEIASFPFKKYNLADHSFSVQIKIKAL